MLVEAEGGKFTKKYPLSSLHLFSNVLLIAPIEWMQQEARGQEIPGNEVSCDTGTEGCGNNIRKKQANDNLRRIPGDHGKKARMMSWKSVT